MTPLNRLLSIFSDFRFIRKYIGGTWYYVRDSYPYNGMTGTMEYWTRKAPEGFEIIKTETY